MSKGFIISFEGIDGSGKTTQIQLLKAYFREKHIAFVATQEPGGTALGREIKQLLFARPDVKISSLAEAFLFQADRAQHFSEIVMSSLKDGAVVVTDRCIDSSIAYQGGIIDIGNDFIQMLNKRSAFHLEPDLTILLDIPVELAKPVNPSLSQDILYGYLIRTAYLTLASRHRERIKVIDATQEIPAIHHEVVKQVNYLLSKGE